MNVFEAAVRRRSIRRFKDKEIPHEVLDRLLSVVWWAPSAGNLQARDVVLVKDREVKSKLADAAYRQQFISEAPVVFVFCANRSRSAKRYGSRGWDLYSIQDATASVENLLLASVAEGLGSCWVGAFDESEVRRILSIPEEVLPVAVVPVGFPDEDPEPPPRYRFLHVDRW